MFGAESGGGAILLISLVFLLIPLAIGVLNLIGLWIAFGKMGDPNWYGIIPVLAQYRIFQRTRPDQVVLFTVLIFVCGIGSLVAIYDLGKLFGKSFLHGLFPILLKDAVFQGPPPPQL